MLRTLALFFTGTLFTGLLASAGLPEAMAADGRPNVLVLMAEDLSARVGAFGDPVARTPNLDRLASEGVRFPNTFTAAGVCAPSRAAFITGMHQISLGAQHMRASTSPIANYLAVPPPEVKAFPELLRRAGYYTFTDRKLDYQFSGIQAGSGPTTIWDSEGAADPLADLPADRPFFGLVNFFITHESAAFTIESQSSAGGAAAARAAATARSALARRTDPESVPVPPYYPDLPEVRSHIADLYDNVQVMDARVGAILDRLQAAGVLDQTIVIWTTDHGDPLPRAKRELFDSGIRVPMIIRWPEKFRPADRHPGAEDRQLISFIDLAPLILAATGVPAPDFLQGRNPLDPATPERRYVYASRDRIDEQIDRVRAVRDDRYKYLRYSYPGTPGATHIAYRDQGRIMQALWKGLEAGALDPVQTLWFEPRPEEALYDLETDPHEVRNLAADPTHLAALTRMRTAYGAWRLRVADLSDQPEAEMADRFWPGGVQPVTGTPSAARTADGRLSLLAPENASIEYRLKDGPWQLYTVPLTVPAGTEVSARAIRYGYALSAELSVTEAPAP